MPDVPRPGPEWKVNKGNLPRSAKGKRVRVVLAHGEEAKYDQRSDTPDGWAADGRGGCRWDLTGAPHDIAWFLVL